MSYCLTEAQSPNMPYKELKIVGIKKGNKKTITRKQFNNNVGSLLHTVIILCTDFHDYII